MAKEFYTEKDIEDMFRRGIMSMEVGENVVLTGLAYEKAGRLGMMLVQERPDNPPSAPVRPYIAQKQDQRPLRLPSAHVYTPLPAAGHQVPAGQKETGAGLQQRIRNAVVARLGGQVDLKLLDVIINRVLKSTGTGESECCSAESGAQPCAPQNTGALKA